MLTLLAVLLTVGGMALAYWAGARTRPTPEPKVDAGPIVARARVLTQEQETTCAPGTSGEYKRHLVYARLIKEHPGLSKREISRAIEEALS